MSASPMSASPISAAPQTARAETIPEDGLRAGRLRPDALNANFGDVAPPLTAHEAHVAADRCYFCYDAPCVTACPTAIDIPMFIRQIAADQEVNAAKTIFDQNILGGMCARVCPTETLCEEACVREAAEGKPVEIGRLQRFATDAAMASDRVLFDRAAPTGKKVAVVGAGPAGLACAHRLALLGHEAVIFEARAKPGGLNEYGIAAYKTVDGFAQSEVEWLLSLGGIEIRYETALGRDVTLAGLQADYDAVFLGLGLGAVNALGLASGAVHGARDAVDFIAELRQAADLSAVPIGRRVVVVGGGMTAIDAAAQSKLLGAEAVTIVYRRGRESMKASRHEQDHAASLGVRIVFNAAPKKVSVTEQGALDAVEFEYVGDSIDGPRGLGETFTLQADQLLMAIGQKLSDAEGLDGVGIDGGRIQIGPDGATSLPKVWAGGDCVRAGEDLTVTAVAQGRDAAHAIHAAISA